MKLKTQTKNKSQPKKKMFYAKFKEANTFKKLIDSIKELVTDANLDISLSGISMQAMDSSHVALVSLNLSCDGFQDFRCDKQLVLGLNIQQVAKILKCCGSEDSLTLKVDEDTNQILFIFEDESNK